MTARKCKGETVAGRPCRRPPSSDSDYCLAHDPDRRDEHAEVSRLGGVARHDPETLGLKAEVRELMAAMRSGEVSAGVGSVLLQAIRLLRELESDDRLNDTGAALIESIQRLRDNPDVPDLSEPAANSGGGGNTGVVEMSEDTDPDAPRFEDYRRADGSLDGEAYLRDVRAHKAVPLSHLRVAQRRKRFASGRL
jgi:hypothetical protein